MLFVWLNIVTLPNLKRGAHANTKYAKAYKLLCVYSTDIFISSIFNTDTIPDSKSGFESTE